MLMMMTMKALESEIVAHEPMVEAVTNMAHHMVTKKHPAEKEINGRLDKLLQCLRELKTLTAERRLKLLDAVESQTVRRRLFNSSEYFTSLQTASSVTK